MNTAFQSIKAGLQQAIAHLENKPAGVVVHEPMAHSEQATPTAAKPREISPK